MKFPYDLRSLAILYTDAEVPKEAIVSSAQQVAGQKKIKADYLFKRFEELTTSQSLRQLSDEMMIAQTIGEALHLSGKVRRLKKADY